MVVGYFIFEPLSYCCGVYFLFFFFIYLRSIIYINILVKNNGYSSEYPCTHLGPPLAEWQHRGGVARQGGASRQCGGGAARRRASPRVSSACGTTARSPASAAASSPVRHPGGGELPKVLFSFFLFLCKSFSIKLPPQLFSDI